MKKNNYIVNKEVEILIKDNLNECSLSSNITKIQTKISNNLYDVMRRQYIDLKDLNLKMLTLCNNKSITLYLMFLTIEIYIKAEVTRNFNMISYDDRKEGIAYKYGNSHFSLNQIGHDIYYFFDFINANCNNPLYTDLLKFQIIQEKIELLSLSQKIKRDYMSLRYNCNKQTDFFFEINEIQLSEKEKIEEVMRYVV